MSGTLVYDGDCGFCTTAVRQLPKFRLRPRALVAWQHADLAGLGLTQAQCEDKLQWVGDDGRHGSGHAAVARMMVASGVFWLLPGTLLLLPPLSWIAAAVYRVVADNRGRLPGGTPACALPQADRPGGGAAGTH